jgi:hypothetical protein
MLTDIDAGIRARFLVHLNQEMLFIAHHPGNARNSHRNAVLVIEALARVELITTERKELLLTAVDSALVDAIQFLRERRGQ